LPDIARRIEHETPTILKGRFILSLNFQDRERAFMTLSRRTNHPHRYNSSMDSPAGQVTQLLREWSGGDSSVAEQLAPIVYAELRRLADAYLRRERPGHTLQPTALIHEAYIRLIQQGLPDWEGRSHFFRFASHLMRQILVDHARLRLAEKRGGSLERIPLVEEAEGASVAEPTDALAVDQALTRLASFDERKAQILELKYFGGMTEEEIAAALEISERTLRRDLRLAKAWMARNLG
jgi:RNA polymerase sigma factor (TIGR02999 family)